MSGSRTLYQMVPIARPRDAVGRMALGLSALASDLDYHPLVFTERQASFGIGGFRLGPLREGLLEEIPWAGERAPAFSVYHHSVGTQVAERFLQWPAEKRVLVYHNITPPELLSGKSAEHARWGLEQLGELAASADLAIGLSRFSCVQLERAGAKRVRQLPYLLWRREWEARPPRGSSRAPLFLMVGRVEPHKGVAEGIEAFRCLRESCPAARLEIVGNCRANPEYLARLEKLARETGNVRFTGKVSDRKLRELYRRADALLVLSAHEGFCVPLVEAMRARLPVVAFRAGAIAETLGEGGVLLDSREPAPVATALLEVSSDDRLRAKIREAQERECERFTVDKFRESFAMLLAPRVG